MYLNVTGLGTTIDIRNSSITLNMYRHKIHSRVLTGDDGYLAAVGLFAGAAAKMLASHQLTLVNQGATASSVRVPAFTTPAAVPASAL